MNTFSPQSVIFNARRESNLSKTTAKLKSSFARPYDLTLKETVDYFLNKPKFGIDNYEPRNLTLN